MRIFVFWPKYRHTDEFDNAIVCTVPCNVNKQNKLVKELETVMDNNLYDNI